MAVVRGRLSGLPSFWILSSVCEPSRNCHPFDSQQKGGISSFLKGIQPHDNSLIQPLHPLTQTATTHPVLLIDTQAPLPELHACASERLHATLDYLTLVACSSLRDSASSDINTITNVARILVQDGRMCLA